MQFCDQLEEKCCGRRALDDYLVSVVWAVEEEMAVGGDTANVEAAVPAAFRECLLERGAESGTILVFEGQQPAEDRNERLRRVCPLLTQSNNESSANFSLRCR